MQYAAIHYHEAHLHTFASIPRCCCCFFASFPDCFPSAAFSVALLVRRTQIKSKNTIWLEFNVFSSIFADSNATRPFVRIVTCRFSACKMASERYASNEQWADRKRRRKFVNMFEFWIEANDFRFDRSVRWYSRAQIDKASILDLTLKLEGANIVYSNAVREGWRRAEWTSEQTTKIGNISLNRLCCDALWLGNGCAFFLSVNTWLPLSRLTNCMCAAADLLKLMCRCHIGMTAQVPHFTCSRRLSINLFQYVRPMLDALWVCRSEIDRS